MEACCINIGSIIYVLMVVYGEQIENWLRKHGW